MTTAVFVEDFQRPPPGLLLAVVDLAQIQHLALGGAAAGGAAVLHDAEIPMRLAVLPAIVLPQKHERRLSHFGNPGFKRVGLHHTVLRAQIRAGGSGSRKSG